MKLTLAFLSSHFSKQPKSQVKNVIISREKKPFNMKQKAYFIVFKGLSLKQIKLTFLKGESPVLKHRLVSLTFILIEKNNRIS